MAHLLQQIFFDSLPSLYLKAMGFLNLVVGFLCAFWEVKGANFTYSKFSHAKEVIQGKRISSRNGMLICYGPSLIASSLFLLSKLEYMKCIPLTGLLSSMSGLGLRQEASPRQLLLASALTTHFLKRELEVLFLHRYSGDMPWQTAQFISFSYFFQTVNLLYAQQLSEGTGPPAIDLLWLGVVLFCIGIAGNFYHHYLLSRMRKDGKSGYLVSTGGSFDLVVCPHYLFEIIDWLGLAFVSQTRFSLFTVYWTLFYLAGRSYATRQWYLKRLDDFPTQRKALLPFIF